MTNFIEQNNITGEHKIRLLRSLVENDIQKTFQKKIKTAKEKEYRNLLKDNENTKLELNDLKDQITELKNNENMKLELNDLQNQIKELKNILTRNNIN